MRFATAFSESRAFFAAAILAGEGATFEAEDPFRVEGAGEED